VNGRLARWAVPVLAVAWIATVAVAAALAIRSASRERRLRDEASAAQLRADGFRRAATLTADELAEARGRPDGPEADERLRRLLRRARDDYRDLLDAGFGDPVGLRARIESIDRALGEVPRVMPDRGGREQADRPGPDRAR